MKVKRIFAATFAAAMIMAAALNVSAADNIETNTDNKNIDMSIGHTYTSKNKVGYMFYDSGSILPWDDVCAYSETRIAPGMKGEAYVKILGANGKTVYRKETKAVDNKINTGYACVEGCDTAKSVLFKGVRRESNSSSGVGYNYTIS